MTATTSRPAAGSARPTRPPEQVAGPPPSKAWAAGARAAGAAWFVGLTLVVAIGLLVWATDDRSRTGAAAALRTLAALWLFAHGATLALPEGRLSLVPIGLCALPFLLVLRTASTAARQCLTASLPAAVGLALSVTVPYTALATVVAVLAADDPVRAPLLTTLPAVASLAFLAALVGACWPGRLWRALPTRFGAGGRRALRAHAMATGVLLAGGAAAAGVSLAMHLPAAVDISQAIAPGPVGAAVLALLGLALAPNAVVLGVAWLSGGGFVLGTGTVVSTGVVQLGPLPGVPLLAAVPANPAPGWLAVGALCVPLLAGSVAGLVLRQGTEGWPEQLRGLAGLAPLTGLTWGLLCWLTGGGAGGGRLSELGAPVWRTAAFLTLEVTLGAVAALLTRELMARRGESPGEPSATSC